MTAAARVLVVGAGIAGSTLAVALARDGVDVELAEIQPMWSPVGVGLTLIGQALRALRSIGLIDGAVANGAPLYRFAVGNERTEVTAVEELPRLNGERSAPRGRHPAARCAPIRQAWRSSPPPSGSARTSHSWAALAEPF